MDQFKSLEIGVSGRPLSKLARPLTSLTRPALGFGRRQGFAHRFDFNLKLQEGLALDRTGDALVFKGLF